MSSDCHALMVEGNRIRELQTVFGAFGYEDIRRDRFLLPAELGELEAAIVDPPVGVDLMVKVAWFTKGWTVIWDPHNNMPLGVEPCRKVSDQLKTRVFGVVWEGGEALNRSSFGWVLHDYGRHVRTVLGGRFSGGFIHEGGGMSRGTVAEGDPLDGEPQNLDEVDASHVDAMVRGVTRVGLAEMRQADYYVVKELRWEPLTTWDAEAEERRAELENQVQDLERIARDPSFADRIRQGAKDRLSAFVHDVTRPEWFRIAAAEALARTSLVDANRNRWAKEASRPGNG